MARRKSPSSGHFYMNLVNEQRDLKELFREYVNESKFTRCLRPETIRGYEAVFNLFLKIMPEVCLLGDLSPEMLNQFFKRIETRQRIVGKKLKTGVKKSTIKTQYSKLNAFFAWLKNNRYIEESPLKDIRPPHVSYDDYKRLTDNELNRIYSAIVRSSGSPLIQRRDTLMISLLLYLGIRKGEFISLQIKDVDILKKEITIRAETSKSKRTRRLVMHPTLVLHFKDYLKERNNSSKKTEQLIVSSRGDRGLSREGLKHWVDSIIKKSGVKFHLHQFRHTFACKLDEGNTTAFKIQKLLGHSSILMTMRYVRSMKTEDMGVEINQLNID